MGEVLRERPPRAERRERTSATTITAVNTAVGHASASLWPVPLRPVLLHVFLLRLDVILIKWPVLFLEELLRPASPHLLFSQELAIGRRPRDGIDRLLDRLLLNANPRRRLPRLIVQNAAFAEAALERRVPLRVDLEEGSGGGLVETASEPRVQRRRVRDALPRAREWAVYLEGHRLRSRRSVRSEVEIGGALPARVGDGGDEWGGALLRAQQHQAEERAQHPLPTRAELRAVPEL